MRSRDVDRPGRKPRVVLRPARTVPLDDESDRLALDALAGLLAAHRPHETEHDSDAT